MVDTKKHIKLKFLIYNLFIYNYFIIIKNKVIERKEFINLINKIKYWSLKVIYFKLIIFCIGLFGKTLIYFNAKGNLLGIAKFLLIIKGFENWLNNFLLSLAISLIPNKVIECINYNLELINISVVIFTIVTVFWFLNKFWNYINNRK